MYKNKSPPPPKKGIWAGDNGRIEKPVAGT